MRKKMTRLALSQVFPTAADSYTAFRPTGLVTPFVALHHFLGESDSSAFCIECVASVDAYRQWLRVGWRPGGTVLAAQ